jgi:hypothetical protein
MDSYAQWRDKGRAVTGELLSRRMPMSWPAPPAVGDRTSPTRASLVAHHE